MTITPETRRVEQENFNKNLYASCAAVTVVNVTPLAIVRLATPVAKIA